MIAYVDSSVVIALIFDEPEAKKFQKDLANYKIIFSSNILEAEVYSACRREGRAFAAAKEFIDNVSLYFSDRSYEPEYQTIARLGYLRGADALHLATAMDFDPGCKKTVFFTADEQQKKLAQLIGFKVVA